MGNSASANIYIEIPKVEFTLGGTVSGKVHISAPQPIETCGVFLKLTGVEQTSWEEEKTKTVKTEENGEENREERKCVRCLYGAYDTFLNQEVPLWQHDGFMQAGQFEIPFSFQLPESLPSSFKLVGNKFGRRFDCSISYRLTAAFKRPGFFKSDISHHVDVLLHAPGPQYAAVRVSVQAEASANQDIYGCCCSCRSQGKFEIAVKSDKNTYHAGETASLQAQVKNLTAVDFPNTSGALTMTLKLRGKLLGENVNWSPGDMGYWSGQHKSTRGIYTDETFHHTESVSQFQGPGVFGGDLRIDDRAIPMSVNIPNYAAASTQGQLIKSEYHLMFTAVPDGCCTTNPTVALPVTVTLLPPPVSQWQQYSAAPTDWHPQTLDSIGFDVVAPSAP